YIDPDGKKIINPNNYVLSNRAFINKLKDFDAAVSRISGLNRNSYTFAITGGDRYKKDGKIYSATNGKIIKKSAKSSRHLQDFGAVAVDLSNPNSISIDVLKQAAEEAGFRYNTDGSEYGYGHFHIDLGLNSKESGDYNNDNEVDKSFRP